MEANASPLLRLHGFLFVEHGAATLVAACTLHAAALVSLSPVIRVSSNYSVVLPVIAAALYGGLWWGLAAGALGLPFNLALFALMGHPEYSPQSKLFAETFGVVVGLALGYLAEYYGALESEIHKRARTEELLRAALGEKEILLRELHHRVKNNLNVIKSLAELQRNRSGDPAFVAAAGELVDRIFAISLVHDQLYAGDSQLVAPGPYLESIAANVASTFAAPAGSIEVRVEVGDRLFSSDAAVALGLVANEALTNAMKYARPRSPGASVRLALVEEAGGYVFSVRDGGSGPAEGPEGDAKGLGMSIIRNLAVKLGGSAELRRARDAGEEEGGAVLEMRWPAG